jgi:LPXTG-motif cell wall-anchored protein
VWIVLAIIVLAVLGGFMILRRRRVADEDAD